MPSLTLEFLLRKLSLFSWVCLLYYLALYLVYLSILPFSVYLIF
jgi:hypothetical protein